VGLEEKAQTEEIDGVVYQVTPVPFGVGKVALLRLIRIISPILAAAAKGESNARAGAIFEVLPGALSDKDVEYFEKLFGPYSEYQDPSGDYKKLVDAARELHFAGRYLAFLKWLIFCMRCNFGDFFAGIVDGVAVGGLVEMVAAKQSP
jgi:hypothetical protein